MEELMSMIQAFINPIPIGGCRVAIISGPGGPAVSSADACEMNNLKLAELAKETQLKLRDLIPEFGSSVSNPVDISLQGALDPTLEKTVYQVVGMDSNVDMILIWITMLTRYRDLLNLQEKISKPIAIVTAIDLSISPEAFSGSRRGFTPIKVKKVPTIVKNLNQKGISIHPNENLAAKALYNIYKFYKKSKK